MAEPKNRALPKLRDWSMFQVPEAKRRKNAAHDGRALPRISELLMEHVQGRPSVKLLWLQEQKAAGNLDGDDPEEIAEAEALLTMLVRLSDSKGGRERRPTGLTAGRAINSRLADNP